MSDALTELRKAGILRVEPQRYHLASRYLWAEPDRAARALRDLARMVRTPRGKSIGAAYDVTPGNTAVTDVPLPAVTVRYIRYICYSAEDGGRAKSDTEAGRHAPEGRAKSDTEAGRVLPCPLSSSMELQKEIQKKSQEREGHSLAPLIFGEKGEAEAEPPAGDQLTADAIWRAWYELHEARALAWPMQNATDMNAARTLAGLVNGGELTVEEFRGSMERLLDDPEEYYQDNGHHWRSDSTTGHMRLCNLLRFLPNKLNSYRQGLNPYEGKPAYVCEEEKDS